MRQITNKLSVSAMIVVFGIFVSAACSSTAKTNVENKNPIAAEETNSAANEKAAENKTASNKHSNENPAKTQADGLPELKKGEDYKTSVRPKMLKAGWKPARSKQADLCGSQEPDCDEFDEYESKTGSDLSTGRINFRWQKGNKFVEISASEGKAYSFESYQFQKDSTTLAQQERWKEFWEDFKTAINRKDKEKLKYLMSESIDGSGAFETREERIAAIERSEMWQSMQEIVSEGTKPEKCEKPCRTTKDGYLIFEYDSIGWWKWTALGGEGMDY